MTKAASKEVETNLIHTQLIAQEPIYILVLNAPKEGRWL
jgi:hypothetical protein